MLAGTHILLGVSGGIAAYKTAWLVRDFVKAGAEVQVVMTPSAAHFVTPLTLSTLSRRRVITDMFPAGSSSDEWTEHIALGIWANVMLVAPATANTIAKIAHGLADNFLTALVLALRCPLVIAPAMDVDMLRNPATRRNIALLRDLGHHIIEPDEGELASGLSGPGRLPEIARLVEEVERVLAGGAKDLAGVRVLISAGPTYEPIDPVRFIGNRSSGKMGFALAASAARRGAAVTLVSGPVHLPTPPGVERCNVETAEQMRAAMVAQASSHDVVIMSAAVADFRPESPADRKIKRSAAQSPITLTLHPNEDILRLLGSGKKDRLHVGFALETGNDVENALKKLEEKNLDLIVLNNPLMEGAGFGSDTNVVTLIGTDRNPQPLEKMPKTEVAERVLDRVARLLRERRQSGESGGHGRS